MKTIRELYRHNADRAHDINQHLPYLAGIAMDCVVQELGFRTGRSTSAFLFGGAKHVHVCDPHPCEAARAVFERLAPDRFTFEQADSIKVRIQAPIDILFIDSYHSGDLLRFELKRFQRYVLKAIVMHDTETYGHKGEDGQEGLQLPICDFLKDHKNWGRMIHFSNNNGLTVLRCDPERPIREAKEAAAELATREAQW
ncbi:hypothetical protein BMS3Bbin02_00099 [bacterium BMS3Bbin02]|nr:hypothetical protein BMS3Bbin02_00099 [bacterium BMS3Bbin02]